MLLHQGGHGKVERRHHLRRDAHLGERENKQLPVVRKHGLRNVHLYEGEEWIPIREAVFEPASFGLASNVIRTGAEALSVGAVGAGAPGVTLGGLDGGG